MALADKRAEADRRDRSPERSERAVRLLRSAGAAPVGFLIVTLSGLAVALSGACPCASPAILQAAEFCE